MLGCLLLLLTSPSVQDGHLTAAQLIILCIGCIYMKSFSWGKFWLYLVPDLPAINFISFSFLLLRG